MDSQMDRKIIIVDDSISIRQELAAVLSGLGYRVLEADDGASGLEMVRSHPDAALMIADINMPGMNGVEMVEAIKAGGQHAGLPILMLTTEGDPEFIARARRAGARAWMTKPFDPALLASTVEKLGGPP